jgi:hypothetical protein
MKKNFLLIIFFAFIFIPEKAFSLTWDQKKNSSFGRNVQDNASAVETGYHAANNSDFPNCRKLNLNHSGLKQGKKITYDVNGKLIFTENGIFDCGYADTSKTKLGFSIFEGIVENFDTNSVQIIFKTDDFKKYFYQKNSDGSWYYYHKDKNYSGAPKESRLATNSEIQHAEKLLSFYKNIDLSSRSAKIYGDKIFNNDNLNTSNISKTSASSSSSKLPNCVGSYNEKTWTNCYGIYKWSTVNERYDGEFQSGYRNGFGTYFYANGNKYIGEWSNDRPNGKGTMIFASGAKYIGEVKNGKRHGQGSYFYSDGERLTGKWNEGEFVDSSSYKKLENDNSNFYKKSKSTENTKLRSSSGVKEYWWVAVLLIGIIFFVYTQTKKDLNINTERSFKPKIRETHNIITQFIEGKKTLGFSFWIMYALLTTINFFLFSILDDYSAKNNLNTLIAQIFAWIVIGCYVFSCMGTWKSATIYKLQKIRTREPFVWATAVYITIVVISILISIGFIQGFLQAI